MVEIPGYRVEGEIARGGMGAVYRGLEPRSGDAVAIKFLSGQTLDPESLARFHREAQVQTELSHPGILRARSYGVVDGAPYLVTDLIPGRSLQRLVNEDGPLPEAQVRRIGARVAAALAHAHAHGVLHRDLKPDNVILTPSGEPVLVDFGLAKRLDAADDRLTRTGEILGTPIYMAPEQAGSASTADHRADLYGLGATLFFLLTGKAPFSSQGGALVVITRVVTAPPRSLRGLRRNVSAELEAVVQRCLAKPPNERYQTATELEQALNAAPPPRPLASWLKPTGAALALALLAAIVAYALEGSSPDLVAPAEPAKQVFGLQALSGAPPAFDREALLATVAPYVSASSPAGSLAPDEALEIGVRLALLGHPDDALSVFSAGLEDSSSLPRAAADLHAARARVLEAKGELALAHLAYDDARGLHANEEWTAYSEACYTALVQQAGSEANALAELGAALDALGRHEQAISAFSEVLTFEPTRADAFAARGRHHMALEDYQRALEDFEQAIGLELHRSRFHHLRALAMQKLGRDYEAQESFERAIKRDRDNADLHFELGMHFLRESALDKIMATHELNTALQIGLSEEREQQARRTLRELFDEGIPR